MSVTELILGVSISLGNRPISTCPAFDRNATGTVEITELIGAVNSALFGCL